MTNKKKKFSSNTKRKKFHFVLAIYSWLLCLPVSVVDKPSDIPLEKTYSPLLQGINCKQLLG